MAVKEKIEKTPEIITIFLDSAALRAIIFKPIGSHRKNYSETSEEGVPPSMVVRFLRSLAAMGVLERLTGILFGRPGGQIPPETFARYDEAILTTVRDEYGLTNLPIVSNTDFGHTAPMFVLPLGIRARIDCDQRKFIILEKAVHNCEII